MIYQLNNGNCYIKEYIKEYNSRVKLIFEGEYLNGIKMEREKNIIIMVD